MLNTNLSGETKYSRNIYTSNKQYQKKNLYM